MTSQPLTPPAATTRDSAVRPPPAAPPNQLDLSVVTDNVTGEVLARLLLEFGQRLRPEFIRALVAACYRDLAGGPSLARSQSCWNGLPGNGSSTR